MNYNKHQCQNAISAEDNSIPTEVTPCDQETCMNNSHVLEGIDTPGNQHSRDQKPKICQNYKIHIMKLNPNNVH